MWRYIFVLQQDNETSDCAKSLKNSGNLYLFFTQAYRKSKLLDTEIYINFLKCWVSRNNWFLTVAILLLIQILCPYAWTVLFIIVIFREVSFQRPIKVCLCFN